MGRNTAKREENFRRQMASVGAFEQHAQIVRLRAEENARQRLIRSSRSG